jgi:hypothetical protein
MIEAAQPVSIEVFCVHRTCSEAFKFRDLSRHPLFVQFTINQACRSNPNTRSLRVHIETTSPGTAHNPTQKVGACPAAGRRSCDLSSSSRPACLSTADPPR